MPDYSKIDIPEVLSYVFYPRDESGPCPRYAFDHFIPVAEAALHCRFYEQDKAWPWILYFHGNGEVVSDYDEIALFYFKHNLNLAVVDYRGYGKSNGTPTVADMSRDSRKVYESVKTALTQRGLRDDLWVMGRSLGSVSARDRLRQEYRHQWAHHRKRFPQHHEPHRPPRHSHTGHGPRRHYPGVPRYGAIDHGPRPHHSRGVRHPCAARRGRRTIYETIGSARKDLLMIPGATHNDIMFVGLRQYMEAIRKFVDSTSPNR